MIPPAAGDGGDLGKRQFEKHLFLIINNIDSSPVDGNDDVILRQTRPSKLVRLIEPREQQRPLVAGIVDNVLLHFQRRDATPYEVALLVGGLNLGDPVRQGFVCGQAIVWDVGWNQRL